MYNRLRVAERSRRRPDAVRPRSAAVHALDGRAAGALAAGALDDVDARHQARRGRARAAERAVGDSGRLEGRRSTKWRAAEPPLQDRRRRDARAGRRTRSTCSTRRSSARGRSRRTGRRRTAFRDRIVAYMTKALREAKVHTSWLSPDEEYEAAVERFVARDPRPAPAEPLPRSLRAVPGARRASSASTTASRSCSSRSRRPACPISIRARSSGI